MPQTPISLDNATWIKFTQLTKERKAEIRKEAQETIKKEVWENEYPDVVIEQEE